MKFWAQCTKALKVLEGEPFVVPLPGIVLAVYLRAVEVIRQWKFKSSPFAAGRRSLDFLEDFSLGLSGSGQAPAYLGRLLLRMQLPACQLAKVQFWTRTWKAFLLTEV